MAGQPQEPLRVKTLKTCETCFRAKIRCDRTQDSGACDRCLRLGKECVFSLARHRKPPPPPSRSRTDRFAERLEIRSGRPTGSRTQSPEQPGSSRTIAAPSFSPSATSGAFSGTLTGTLDPIASGKLTEEHAATLLHTFNSRMAPHFPFVRLPATMSVEMLRQQRPCLCLAVLAAASFDDIALQRSLSQSFNAAVAAKLVHGHMVSLDLLQGFLVHTSWAHYQPRPRRHSQHLHLATSIVSDMRLDRPKNLSLWNVEKSEKVGPEHAQESRWNNEELRTLVGTYYLASHSSIVLQKLRHFPYSDFILESATELGALGEYPTDVYLQHIVRLQALSEAADDILRHTSSVSSVEVINEQFAKVRAELDSFKSSLSFPLSDCSVLVLQVGFLELLLGQMSLPEFPFGQTRLQTKTIVAADDTQLANCLAQVASASRSLVSFLLSMTPGEEFVITNMAWVMLSCGLSLAVRLDVLVKRDPRVSPLTQHLVQFLDIQHSLRQIILRLESAAASSSAASPTHEMDGPNTFSQFLARARAIESWHQRQLRQQQQLTTVPSLSEPSVPTNPSVNTPSINISPATLGGTAHVPDINVSFGANAILYEAGSIDGTPSHTVNAVNTVNMANFQDFSVLDFLFDRPMPEFDSYMAGL